MKRGDLILGTPDVVERPSLVYMGLGSIPENSDDDYDEPVAHVRVDPSVLVIPYNAFSGVPMETIELRKSP